MFVLRHTDKRHSGAPFWGDVALVCPMANRYEPSIQPTRTA